MHMYMNKTYTGTVLQPAAILFAIIRGHMVSNKAFIHSIAKHGFNSI